MNCLPRGHCTLCSGSLMLPCSFSPGISAGGCRWTGDTAQGSGSAFLSPPGSLSHISNKAIKGAEGQLPPFLQCRVGCSSRSSQCLWLAVGLPWHPKPLLVKLSNATSHGHPEQGCAGGKGWFNNK